jgi:hypothetical protein
MFPLGTKMNLHSFDIIFVAESNKFYSGWSFRPAENRQNNQRDAVGIEFVKR